MQTLQTEFPSAGAESENPPAALVPAGVAVSGSSGGDAAAGGLIPIEIEVRGEVVSSNFATFAEAVRTRLSEINRNLVTDEDFDQADKDAKAIAGAEAALKAAKEKALADAEQLHALFGQIDGLSGDLAAARLDLDKQIKKRKDEVKAEIISEALARFDEIEAPGAKTVFRKSVEDAVKGKRTVESMKRAVNVVMGIRLGIVKTNRERIASFEKAHGAAMTLDRHELELRSPDHVEAELRRRFDLKKAEDERKRLAEEAEKSKAEAQAAIKKAEEAGKPPAPPASIPASQRRVETDESPFARSQPATVGFTDGPHGPGVIEPPSEHQEWDAFEKTFLAAFGPVKEAREALKHPKNIARAQVLANSIANVWNNR